MKDILTLKQYAKAAGVTTVTILKRIHKGLIKPGVGVEGRRLVFTIDVNEYPLKSNGKGKQGRPRKSA